MAVGFHAFSSVWPGFARLSIEELLNLTPAKTQTVSYVNTLLANDAVIPCGTSNANLVAVIFRDVSLVAAARKQSSILAGTFAAGVIMQEHDGVGRSRNGRLEDFACGRRHAVETAQRDEVVAQAAAAGVEHQHHERLLARVIPAGLLEFAIHARLQEATDPIGLDINLGHHGVVWVIFNGKKALEALFAG